MHLQKTKKFIRVIADFQTIIFLIKFTHTHQSMKKKDKGKKQNYE